MTNKNTDKVDSVEINSTESLVPEFSIFDFKTNKYSHAVANEQVRMLFGYSQLISISNSFFASRRSYINAYENIYYHITEVEQRKILILAKELVEKSSKAKSDFLSRMSHELRTPLNAILGFGQMLELDADDLSHTQKDNVAEILNAGQHLLNLINEVLDLSRIESGKLEMHLETISVSRSLHEAIKLIQEPAKNRHIHIIDHISEQNFYVYADAIRLKQVFVNLLSNAVKYNSDHGKIILEAHVTDGLYLTINISDTGEGLTEQEVDLLFVPFDRLNAKNNVEGTGIGLVITQHLIRLMNGKLNVVSSQGKGSTFSIELLLPEI